MQLALLALVALLTACDSRNEDQARTYTVPKASKPITSTTAPVATPAMPANPALIAQTSAIGQPVFPATPTGWTALDPGAMRKGSWKVTVGTAQAELAVTAFPGDVGGRMANINRWRGQLGLPPGDAEMYDAIQLVTIGDSQGELIWIQSTDEKRATLAATVQKNGVSWFLKFTGDTEAVKGAQKDFINFLTNTRLP